MTEPKKIAYFVTGTDTDVGKTLVSAALIQCFADQELRVIGMKPVAAGCYQLGDQLMSDDVAQLILASNIVAPIHHVNPYAFSQAIAPSIAADIAGIEIRMEVIEQAYAQLVKEADVVIVEGVGGFCVPLSAHFDTADLAQKLALPVILVVGMRLGCLNHALLTAEAIKTRGLKLAGWIANQPNSEMVAFDENFQILNQRLQAPCLGILDWMDRADFKDGFVERVARQLRLEKLGVLKV
ncbi:MAG: dethiobiotin synthase [Methylophilaceae bacterium]